MHTARSRFAAASAGSLDLKAARAYVLVLVKRDHAVAGLEPRVSDDAAQLAAQAHADDSKGSGLLSWCNGQRTLVTDETF